MPHDIILDKSAKEAVHELGIEPIVAQTVGSQKEVDKASAIIVLSTDPDRELLKKAVDGAIAIENKAARDSLHYRKAGLDQVSARMMAREGKALVLSIHTIRESKDKQQAMGRMIQNAQVAKKAGMPIVLASGARTQQEAVTRHDLEAFFRAIGIPQDVVESSEKDMDEWVARARHRASEEYVAEGVSKTESL